MDTKLTQIQKEWLNHVADTRQDPYRTMAMDAIMFDDIKQFNTLVERLNSPESIQETLTKEISSLITQLPKIMKEMNGKEFNITITVPASENLTVNSSPLVDKVKEEDYLSTKALVSKLKEKYKHVAEQFEFPFMGSVHTKV